MNNRINPDKTTTEILIIRDVHRSKSNKKITINWEKFPRLRVLDLYIFDIELKGIEQCKMLESVRIDTFAKTCLPSTVSDLTGLRFIATTCYTSEPLHFVSKSLKSCFVPKKHAFTSESALVPKFHLCKNAMNNAINIQCFDPLDYVVEDLRC
jgi:hypothetical protein